MSPLLTEEIRFSHINSIVLYISGKGFIKMVLPYETDQFREIVWGPYCGGKLDQCFSTSVP